MHSDSRKSTQLRPDFFSRKLSSNCSISASSLNPDDSYRVVVFTLNLLGLDGGILNPACRNPADLHRVANQILRWHFRQ